MKLCIGEHRHINGHLCAFRERRADELHWWDTVDRVVIKTGLRPKVDRKQYDMTKRLAKQKQSMGAPAIALPSDEELERLAVQNNLTIEEAIEAFR